MIDSRFSLAEFKDAGLAEIPSLLGDLQAEIALQVQDAIASSDQESSVHSFFKATELVVEQLNRLGHSLSCLEIESVIELDQCHNYFTFDGSSKELSGLQLDIRPSRIHVQWVVNSDRLLCTSCGRPSGRKMGVGACQYCGVDI